MGDRRRNQECGCSPRRGVRTGEGSVKGKCKRKRQTLVYNPDEEIWHEPYMQCLRKEFSDISIPCDSKIELPWKDIALPAVVMKIRPNVTLEDNVDAAGDEINEQMEQEKVEKKESTGTMKLPWNDLLITETVQARSKFKDSAAASCDSTLEIPWNELTLERPIEIKAPPEVESCELDDIEIPWDDILVPRNIVIESKRKKHPSSKASHRSLAKSTRNTICCAKPCCERNRFPNIDLTYGKY